MSLVEENATLSFPATIVYFYGFLLIFYVAYFFSLEAGKVCLLTIIPAVIAGELWQKNNKASPLRRGELEPIVWTFVSAATIGFLGLTGIQHVILACLSRVLFGSGEAKDYFVQEYRRDTLEGLTLQELAKRAAIVASWQNWVLTAAVSIISKALLEETLLFLPVLFAKWLRTPYERRHQDRAYIDYAMAGALGLALAENLKFVIVVAETEESWRQLALSTLKHTFAVNLGRVALATYTAVRATRRDFYGDKLTWWWGCVKPAVLFQGGRLIAADIFIALDGNVGMISPTGLWMSLGMWMLVPIINTCAVGMVLDAWEDLGRRDEKKSQLIQDLAQKKGIPIWEALELVGADLAGKPEVALHKYRQ